MIESAGHRLTFTSDLAYKFPECETTMTDIADMRPAETPAKCILYIDNVNNLWTWGGNRFDWVHARGLAGAVNDWPKFFGQVMECLEEGCYLEMCDISLPKAEDGSVLADNIWLTESAAVRTLRKESFTITERCEEWMREAGFDVISHSRVALKLEGPVLELMAERFEGAEISWLADSGLSSEQAWAHLEDVRRRLREKHGGLFVEV